MAVKASVLLGNCLRLHEEILMITYMYLVDIIHCHGYTHVYKLYIYMLHSKMRLHSGPVFSVRCRGSINRSGLYRQQHIQHTGILSDIDTLLTIGKPDSYVEQLIVHIEFVCGASCPINNEIG